MSDPAKPLSLITADPAVWDLFNQVKDSLQGRVFTLPRDAKLEAVGFEPAGLCPGSGAAVIYASAEVVCACGRTLGPVEGRVPPHPAPGQGPRP